MRLVRSSRPGGGARRGSRKLAAATRAFLSDCHWAIEDDNVNPVVTNNTLRNGLGPALQLVFADQEMDDEDVPSTNVRFLRNTSEAAQHGVDRRALERSRIGRYRLAPAELASVLGFPGRAPGEIALVIGISLGPLALELLLAALEAR